MLNKASMNKLTQAERIAYFRAELNLCSPEGSSLDEKKEIYNEMMDTSMALLDAMRADFEQLPPAERERLLDILCKFGVESPNWWRDVLVGEGDPLYRDLEPLR